MSPSIMDSLLPILTSLGEKSITILEEFGISVDDNRVRFGVAITLGKLGKMAIPALTKLATSDNVPWIRINAAYNLGKFGATPNLD